MKLLGDHRTTALVGLGLLIGTSLVYLPVRQNGFINFDDPLYLTNNPIVQAGLTTDGLKWAFGRISGEGTYWHPLTWLSHMLDCQLFGLRAGAHHVVSAGLHAVNAMLLFLALNRLTGMTWRSAAVAALFALHPLQVDSVAWASERKNLLSGLFWMLGLLTYPGYVRKPGRGRYWIVLGFLALGLMAKPTLVVMPFVLLLLDFWPLRRINFGGDRLASTKACGEVISLKQAILEKLPLLALSLAACVVTLLAHERLAVIHSSAHFSLAARMDNALVSYARYLGKIFWPSHLSFFYPHPGHWPLGRILWSAMWLLSVSWLAWWQRHARPYLVVGWWWFIGSLVPVIGLIQVSDQAMADRFAYLPLIGVLIMVVWGAADVFAHQNRPLPMQYGLAVTVLVACGIATQLQLRHWRNSETLFRHALSVTKDNYVAHNNLGNVLDRAGKYDEARGHYEAAIRIRPRLGGAHFNLANLLAREGNFAAALEHYQAAVEFEPEHPDAHYNLGVTLTKLDHPEDAAAQYAEALRLRPDFAEAHYGLGEIYFHRGQIPEAIAELAATVRLQPTAARVLNELGILLARQGDPAGAATNFARLVNLEPQNPDAHYNLGNSLLAQGRTNEAALQYSQVLRLNPQDQKAREKIERLNRAVPGSDP